MAIRSSTAEELTGHRLPGVAEPGSPLADRPGAIAYRHEVHIGSEQRPGELATPPNALGMVLIAEGGGGHRRGPRSPLVADVMHRYGLGTLCFDLLTDAEAGDHHKALDSALLARRVCDALAWQRGDDAAHLQVGLFGIGAGVAAAWRAAAAHPSWVAALVSPGGRPDLAEVSLRALKAPTLLIVGGRDVEVLDSVRSALRALKCATRLEVVPGATHDFDEPGAMETVAHLAGSWFATHLPAARLR